MKNNICSFPNVSNVDTRMTGKSEQRENFGENGQKTEFLMLRSKRFESSVTRVAVIKQLVY